MRPAERVAEVVGPPLAGEVEQSTSKIQIDATTAKQGWTREVERVSWLYTASLEVDKFGARPLLQFVEFFPLNFQRSSAFISTGEGQ